MFGSTGFIGRWGLHGVLDEPPSVRDLTVAICTYIDCWNDRAHPSGWTKNAEVILAKAKRPENSNTGH